MEQGRRTDLLASQQPPAPFIFGVPRSGTSLLRLMCDSHPDLAIPPETRFIPRLIRMCRGRRTSSQEMMDVMTSCRRWADFGIDNDELHARLDALSRPRPGAVAREFYRAYAARFGKQRWGDKTPRYRRFMPTIASALPEARFIHIIRDGRDVARSLQGFYLNQDRDPGSLAHWAGGWARSIQRTRAKSQKVDHYVEIFYEDLVRDPRAILGQLCEMLALPFDERMLAPHEQAPERLAEMAGGLPPSARRPGRSGEQRLRPHQMLKQPVTEERSGAWRNAMTAAEQEEFEAVAGETLAELGYELGAAARR
ncbi:MAG: sulfotransferase [Actinomycetota bacterium]|nr:sulfotransferase [Actinomycetota bacterium]